MPASISPQRQFCEAVKKWTGLNPSAEFLRSYWDTIEKEPENFLDQLIFSWCIRPFLHDEYYYRATKKDVFSFDANIVSINFLLRVEANQFLEFAYMDFLGRPVTDIDRAGFTGMDFVKIQTRITVIMAMIKSPEATGKQYAFISDDQQKDLFTPRSFWIRTHPNHALLTHGIKMKKVLGAGAAQKKFPLLWKSETDESIFCAFGMVVNLEQNASNCTAKSEWIFFGPRIPVESGTYSVRLHVVGNMTDLFHFDIVSSGGTKDWKSIKFFGSVDLSLHVVIDSEIDDLEFRLVNMNGRPIDIEIKEVSLCPIF